MKTINDSRNRLHVLFVLTIVRREKESPQKGMSSESCHPSP